MNGKGLATGSGRVGQGLATPRGYLLLHLHAHLPFIRHPEDERFLEENWLNEALTETYLPLLLVLDQLVRDGVDFRLSLSLTPTLLAMLDDPLLKDRFERKLVGLADRGQDAPVGISSLERPAVREPPHLEVKADLVIYGRTQPGTDLVIDGVKVPVREDGTFDLRFALPRVLEPKSERRARAPGGARRAGGDSHDPVRSSHDPARSSHDPARREGGGSQ